MRVAIVLDIVGKIMSEKGAAGSHVQSRRGGAENFRHQMIEQIIKSPGNEITFLPTGLGQMKVVDAVIDTMLSRFPEKHVVVCVLRPAQVLSGAQRLRRSLKGRVPVGAYVVGLYVSCICAYYYRVVVFFVQVLRGRLSVRFPQGV